MDLRTSLSVLVDREFALEMLKTEMTESVRKRMKKLGNKLLKEYKHSTAEPFVYYKDTSFVTQFTVDGGEGKWLSLNPYDHPRSMELCSKEKTIKYYSSNSDTTGDDLAMMGLVELWANYATTVRETRT